MPVLGHRNSPSPARPMERIALPDGSLSPRSGAAGSLPVVNRPRCKFQAKGSVQAVLGKPEPNIDGESICPMKASDAVVVLDIMATDGDIKAKSASDDDSDTAPLQSPRGNKKANDMIFLLGLIGDTEKEARRRANPFFK